MVSLITYFLLIGCFLPSLVWGHGYMKTPRSRNFVAYEDGKEWPLTVDSPKKEYCPHCLNLGGTSARCGLVGSNNYDYPKNGKGGPLASSVQKVYSPNEEITVDVVLTAHHKGHFVLKACPIEEGEVPTQACFDSYPLTFVEDLLYGAPVDVNYPERGYIAPSTHPDMVMDNSGVPGYLFTHKYRLPQGLSGDLVLLQWHYYTANSCVYAGYNSYPWPDSSWDPNLAICGNIPADGNGVPEQFWNCAEISIVGGPVAPTTSSPTPVPTPLTPVTAPVAPPTTTGTCGGGYVGNGICNDGKCCSYWGWCVQTNDFCGEMPVASPTSAPVTPAPTNTPATEAPSITPATPAPTNTPATPAPTNTPATEAPSITPVTPAPTNTPATPAPTNTPATPAPTNTLATEAPSITPVTPAPTNTPATPAPSSSPVASPNVKEDSRLVAYLGNWQACPSASHVAKYTHIVIAFAVSYTWSPSKNNCDPTCQINTPPVCNNQNNPALIKEWQNAGKKVLLGFGGAGMGGSWASDNNDCWEYCFGREDQVVNNIVKIVNDLGLDGVDIDYEYFYEDNQNGSGFTKGAEAIKFLREVTVGIKDDLPVGSIVTHAPMDTDVVPGTKYFELLNDIAPYIDFLMPQYYNGVTRPVIDGIANRGSGAMAAITHYDDLVDIFDEDPTRIVFGFCISDCSGTGSNANANGAAQVMSDLQTYYDCNGGAFFWVATHDTSGAWSRTVSAVTEQTAGCSLGPTAPFSPPVSSPTAMPVALPPTAAPVVTPTESPVSSPTASCCPPGHTGYRATNDCTQYLYCRNGVPDSGRLDCGNGLLFDNKFQYCNWANQVTCQSCGGSSPPPPTPAPTSSPNSPSQPCCPSGFTGLRSHDSCTKYFHCVNGVVTGSPLSCAANTLFDDSIQNCNWSYAVTCTSSPCNRRLRGFY